MSHKRSIWFLLCAKALLLGADFFGCSLLFDRGTPCKITSPLQGVYGRRNQYSNLQEEQPGAIGAGAEMFVTDVLPGPPEEYARDIFITPRDISCFGEVRSYMMTFTTA